MQAGSRSHCNGQNAGGEELTASFRCRCGAVIRQYQTRPDSRQSSNYRGAGIPRHASTLACR